MDGYRVDLARLEAIMSRMERFDRVLEWVLEDADHQVEKLHRTWTGNAAAQHREAHRKWTEGAAELKQALIEMHKVASTAHSNYRNAAETNAAMWRQAR